MFERVKNAILYRDGYERVLIEAWGKDSIRVRASENAEILELPGALSEPQQRPVDITIHESEAVLINHKIKATVDKEGKITFHNTDTGALLLEEKGPARRPSPIIKYPGRHYRHKEGDGFEFRLEFISDPDEKIYGLGQHPDGFFNLKGNSYELVHVNSEWAVPFILSTKKYGFLWNHPGKGKAELSYNRTLWSAPQGKQIDYWVTTGDAYKDILERYAEATGKSPVLPEWALGYWQSKNRYKTQEELLNVAREYKRRNIPLDVIVIDFFHWTSMGDWRFDLKCWPDPKAMVEELDRMGMKAMVSVWPTVETNCENFEEIEKKGLLIKNQAGIPGMQRHFFRYVQSEHNEDAKAEAKPERYYIGFIDSTNPEARKFMWEKIKENYYAYGIKLFWLDANEPVLPYMNYDNLRYYLGNGEEVTGIYPNMHIGAVCDGLRQEGAKDFFVLARSGWAGVQKYPAVLWSGDIQSTFESLKKQVTAGLNAAMSGISWWNTDIGGYILPPGEDKIDPELLLRWFQYGAFCPIMRLHGLRSRNEIWSFGEKEYEIMKMYIQIREELKPYIMQAARRANQSGLPIMRPLLLDFEQDEHCFSVSEQYMFGAGLMAAPVTDRGAQAKRVYLPAGTLWKDAWTGEEFNGGQWIQVNAPLSRIPLFIPGSYDDVDGLLNIFKKYGGIPMP